jgi:Family of unknown function (DUF5850)
MALSRQTYLFIGGVIVLGVVAGIGVWLWMRNKEPYSSIGDVDNIGSLDDSLDMQRQQRSAEYYANLVSASEQDEYAGSLEASNPAFEGTNPMQRLERLQNSEMLPRVSRNVTPYNVDIADPKTHSYMVNPPRVQLKDPIYILADPIRGDIPITYHPEISLVNRTRYGRDSLRLDGFFSDAFSDLYNKFTGRGYKNLPQKVVGNEVLMDFV